MESIFLVLVYLYFSEFLSSSWRSRGARVLVTFREIIPISTTEKDFFENNFLQAGVR